MSTSDEINEAPQAASVSVFFCHNPKCLRPHVVLFNDDGKPFAQFICPDIRADGGSFIQDLQDAAYVGVVGRDK